MKIGIAGPMSLDLIDHSIDKRKLPEGYPFPPMSSFVNGFLRKGHEIIAFTYSRGIEKPLILKDDKITICIAKRREKHAARDFFKYEVNQLVELMNSFEMDILASQWSYEFSLAALKSKQITTIRLRDYPPKILKMHLHPYQFIRTLIHYYCVNKANSINVNSEYLLNLLPTKIKKKAVVIPNFYSSELELIYNNNISNSNYIVSVSNGFGKIKNIENGLKAFKLVRQKNKNLEYHIIGSDMEEGGAAFNYAKKYGLLEGVKFLGFLPFEKVVEQIKNAKLFLHTSREESFGMAVLEAMVIGTPVIGGENSGNIPYLLDKGKCGILCNINDSISIAKSIESVISDKIDILGIRDKARQYAKLYFSEDVVVNNFVNYYEQIIKRSKKG
jgi:glycosyltransferase involved in cell wall biosynthesis